MRFLLIILFIFCVSCDLIKKEDCRIKGKISCSTPPYTLKCYYTKLIDNRPITYKIRCRDGYNYLVPKNGCIVNLGKK